MNALFLADSFVDTTVFQSAATELVIVMDDLSPSFGEDFPSPAAGSIPLTVDSDRRILAISANVTSDGTVSVTNVDESTLMAVEQSAGPDFTYYQVCLSLAY